MGIERTEEGKRAKGGLVQDIVSIEVEADRIVEQAQEKADALLKEAQRKAAEVRGGVEETIRAEFAKLKTHYEGVLEKERADLGKAHELTLQKVTFVDEEQRKALVEHIVKRVVEG